jgi:hypothetical protein
VKPIDDFSGKGLSATDSERQIIAAILEGATDHLSAMARILPDASAFLDRECSLIWGFALRIRAAGQPVCLLTIKTSMLADGAVSDPNDILILLQGSHSLINE